MPFRFPFLKKPAQPSRLKQVHTYTIYYDFPSDSVMSKLSTFDLVIIEPHLYNRQQVAEIESGGTRTIGYLSVMQAPSWNIERFNHLLPSDFLLKNGQKQHFPEWDSYLMDLRQPHYQELLLAEIEQHIAEKGFYGIMLDTVADIDEQFDDPLLQAEQQEAYLAFLQQVRHRYPRFALIQNRGFSTLDLAMPYIDGTLWEDWQAGWKHHPWMKQQVDRVKRLKKEGLLVLSVSTDPTARHQSEAEKLGFVHTIKPGGYQVL